MKLRARTISVFHLAATMLAIVWMWPHSNSAQSLTNSAMDDSSLFATYARCGLVYNSPRIVILEESSQALGIESSTREIPSRMIFQKRALQINSEASSTPAPSSPQALLIERIEIQGATKTRHSVIHRYLSMKIGGAITPEIISQDYDALAATNFFKRVDFSSKPGSAPGKVVVVIEIVERYWPWLEVAGGFSELEGWYLIPLGVRFDNFFGGGDLGGARFLIADRTGGFYLHYRLPQIFKSSFDLQAELGGLDHQFIHYVDNREALHKVNNGEVSLALLGTRGFARHFSGGFKFNQWRPEAQATFTDTDSSFQLLQNPLAAQLAETKVNSFFLRLEKDTRNDRLFPQRGLWGALAFEVADSVFGSDVNFTSLVFDGRFYAPIGRNTFALHAKAARVSEAAPFYERFYLGGAYSLRGFAERSLTPLGWGTELLLAQAEMRFPVAGNMQRPSMSATVFFDIGSLKTPKGSHDFTSAAGFGFRLKAPIVGLLRCDFAYPLDRDDFRFHIALGQTF